MLQFVLLSVLVAGCYAIPLPNEGRIVNGTNAVNGEIPYIVSIRINGGGHGCGGSILDATHVLTAAHCVYGMSSFAIQYGVLNIRSNENVIRVIGATYHGAYQPYGGYINDIAVLTLESPIKFGQNAQPTVLPPANQATPGEAPSVLAGWGYEQSGGSVQNDLKRVDLKIYTDNECERIHQNADRQYHVCSGVVQGGQGQCSGDSGGPLYANGVQVGVVSWSVKPCAITGYPGVFAKVANYIDWINEQL